MEVTAANAYLWLHNSNTKKRAEINLGDPICKLGKGQFQQVESVEDAPFPYMLAQYKKVKDAVQVLEKDTLLMADGKVQTVA